MGLLSDLRILYHLTLKPVRGGCHAERMEAFYSGQAEHYDEFRQRLLQGRQELWDAISEPDDAVWVDMGGGTGSNLEFFGPRIDRLKQIHVVDLSPSLLEVADRRIQQRGWADRADTIAADATCFEPPTPPVDVVTFSYSLTMIPDWFAAIENARSMLRPGGQIGVVDFYVSRKHPPAGLRRHRWWTRSFWPAWFASDNVFPSPDHAPFLHRRFEPLFFSECSAKIPYLPFVRAPYYIFVGRKPLETEADANQQTPESAV
jgi:S-adenosylmethionine-diacylgycerolhomoserine-N-methlytransferase